MTVSKVILDASRQANYQETILTYQKMHVECKARGKIVNMVRVDGMKTNSLSFRRKICKSSIGSIESQYQSSQALSIDPQTHFLINQT